MADVTRRWITTALATVLACLLFSDCGSAEDDEVYRGKYLGKLNAYHHQVSGDVYVVDEYTLLLTSFSYDGNGADTFFWAGASNRPGPQGFIVPDEWGKTNILDRYFNKDFTLTLPDNKKVTDIKWFAIYDLGSQNTFGDVYIPEEFDPPAPQKISQLTKRSHGVSSESIVIVDSKTIRIPEFTYDGQGTDTYFWVGLGPQPSSKGTKVPDEYGYLDPIRAYKGDDIMIQLPGDMTVFNIDWLSVFDVKTKSNYGSVIIPDGLNVPPSLVKVIKHTQTLPNCIQLHKRFQVGWEIFGPQITVQLAGQVGEDEYMAFGLSGSETSSQMEGADVVVAYMDGTRGYTVDYNITAKAPCGKVLGQYRGVCKDELVGGLDSNQLYTAVREDGINIITYRRTLNSSDPGDKEYPTDRPVYVIWALGKLDENKEPTFHDQYPKGDLKLELVRQEPDNTCMDFTENDESLIEVWEKAEIFDRSIRTFKATIGPSGGKKGYQGMTGQTSTGLAWYIEGQLVPELYLRRGLTYNFRVHGGNNPHSPNLYHPLIITDEPHGGYDRLSEAAQSRIRVLAGVEFTRRGQPRPTAVGPLCLSKHNERDRRLDDDFPTFKHFNRTLLHKCEPGEGGVLEVTPNSTWPDTVYYNSFTHANMGWKIYVVDAFSRSNGVTLKLSLLAGLAAVFFLRSIENCRLQCDERDDVCYLPRIILADAILREVLESFKSGCVILIVLELKVVSSDGENRKKGRARVTRLPRENATEHFYGSCSRVNISVYGKDLEQSTVTIFPMEKKHITLTTIEGEVGAKLDKAFGTKPSFFRVQPSNCILPPHFVFYGSRIRDMEIYEDDVWLVSYPRTGSHWAQEMVWCIGNDFNYEKAQTLLLLRNPLLEGSSLMVSGDYAEWFAKLGDSVKNVENMPRPRYVKSHLPADLLPQQIHEKKPKVIYVSRNPKDTCVSFYHYCRTFHNITCSFEDFAELFLQGNTPMGSYWDHVLMYWSMRDNGNLLFLTYEEMKKNQAEAIRRTAKFLGKTASEEQIKGLTEHLEFSKMAANPAINLEQIMPQKDVPEDNKFIRKGKVGDWRNYMSQELSQRFDKWTESKLSGSGLDYNKYTVSGDEE